MKKLTCLGLSIVMALSLLAGCGGGETSTPGTSTPDGTPTSTPAASTPDTEEISGTVNTDGSTSMADVMAAFTESFGNMYPGEIGRAHV